MTFREQRGGVRCVRCCIDKPRNYVLLKGIGGVAERFRWLCAECLEVYRGLELVGAESRPIRERAQDVAAVRDYSRRKW